MTERLSDDLLRELYEERIPWIASMASVRAMAQELLARRDAEREPQKCNSPLEGLREKIAVVIDDHDIEVDVLRRRGTPWREVNASEHSSAIVADRILALIKESAE